MEPRTKEPRGAVEGLTEEELAGDEGLNELEVEDLLGHHIEFDEEDDWRALDL